MESVQFIQWCLDNLNYWTITLLMAIESSFIPFPSEVVVPPAAYKAAATGELNVWLVIFFATVGAIIGALINYYLALWLGKPIVYKFANSRIGHMCLLDQAKVETAEKFFRKHGAIATFTGRLVPAVRQLISIPAGPHAETLENLKIRFGCQHGKIEFTRMLNHFMGFVLLDHRNCHTHRIIGHLHRRIDNAGIVKSFFPG